MFAASPQRPGALPSRTWVGWVGLLVLIGLVAAGCGELTPPAAYSSTTSSTLPATPEGDGEPDEEESTDVRQTTEERFPAADPGYVPSLLVASDRPVFAVEGLESTPLTGPLDGVQGVRVFDDLGGGLVIQQNDDSIVYRQSQTETELLGASDATLLDVGYWGASPRAFVRSTPERVDWIQLATEEPGVYEQRTHFELDEGERIVAFSASRDTQAVVIQDEDCGEIRFYDSGGQRLALPAPTPPPCTFPGRPSFGAVALSPDGGAMAYTVVTYRDDGTEQVTELTAVELIGDQATLASRRVGENLDAISSLTYDGKRVGYIRSSAGVESVAILDLGDGSELVVELPDDVTDIHSVAFTRVPIEVGP